MNATLMTTDLDDDQVDSPPECEGCGAVWDRIEDWWAWSADHEAHMDAAFAGPQDEDLVTSDHRRVFEHGSGRGPVLETTPDTFERDVRRWQEAHGWFPNTWFLDDHGGATLVLVWGA